MKNRKGLLVVQVAALDEYMLKLHGDSETPSFVPMEGLFPALTCPVQATVRTGKTPAVHGVTGNGFMDRDSRRTFFWEQSSRLVEGERIWENFRRNGGRVGMMFWQQSLGTDVDLVLSPAPVHKHHGGMIEDCFCVPSDLYARLVDALGGPFPLKRYWGPGADVRSSRWIVSAAVQVMKEAAVDVLFTYVPHLDYALQVHGPSSAPARRAFAELMDMLRFLVEEASKDGYDAVVYGDYGIMDVERVVYPNRILREAGLMKVRRVGKRVYHDPFTSTAFAVVDHQIAHVYTDGDCTEEAAAALADIEGVAEVLLGDELHRRGIAHRRCGDIVLTAEPDSWFAYYWWREDEYPPDYASHVDIHNKPGYDPCELLWGRWPVSVGMDPSRIRGSHGRADDAHRPVCFSNVDGWTTPSDFISLAKAIHRLMDGAIDAGA